MRVHPAILALMGMLLLASSPASALQGTPFSFGPKVGVNLANIWGDEPELFTEDGSMKTGIVAGAFGAYAVSEWITLQTEILYSQKGADFDFGKLKLDYIEIPILAMVTIPTGGRFEPNLSIGPSIAFNVKARGEDTDIKDFIKTTDVGIAFGAGLKIHEIGPGAITFDFRYTLGLSNILDDVPYDVSIRNQALAIMLGFAF